MEYTSPTEVSTLVDEAADQIGHAIIQIDTGDSRTGYAYTAGLSAVGWHDLIIVGLDPAVSGRVMDGLLTHLRRSEIRPAAGSVFRIGDPAIRLELRAVPDAIALGRAVYAFDYRDRHAPHATSPGMLQVLWPDAQGRSPMDPCYDAAMSTQNLPSAPE